MTDKQLLRAMYEKDKLKLGTGYFLWFIGFHYAHLGKIGMQIIFTISIFFGIGIIWRLLQGLEVRSNIDRYNRELAIKYGLDIN